MHCLIIRNVEFSDQIGDVIIGETWKHDMYE